MLNEHVLDVHDRSTRKAFTCEECDIVVAGEQLSWDAVLRADNLTIRGQVQDARGQPHPGAWVAHRRNDAGHETLRNGAESPQLICDAVQESLSSSEPRFRYPLGALAPVAASLKAASDDHVHATIAEMFGVADWAAEVTA